MTFLDVVASANKTLMAISLYSCHALIMSAVFAAVSQQFVKIWTFKRCFLFFPLFVVTYTRHQNRDCLLFSDLHVMSSSIAEDFENNKKWCTGNSSCGGFTIFNGVAWFKGQCCKNNLFYNRNRFTYIKDEN